MKIVMISDTHGMHGWIKDLPEGDVIVHAGDISMRGYKNQVLDFLAWFESLKQYKHKIFIAGNHDFFFEHFPKDVPAIIPPNVTYLEDSGVCIDNVNFWGSPISPWFHSWAFNRYRGEIIKKHWDLIPDTTDFLIVHGPPYRILDKVDNHYNAEQNVGCKDLKNRIFQLPNLKVVATGHIHEAAGFEEVNNIKVINASMVDGDYKIGNKPYIVDMETLIVTQP